MSTTTRRAREIGPTDQYKIAVNGIKCGDRSFAEDFLRKQLGRARSVYEAFDIAAQLGWLSERGLEAAGFTPTQLALPVGGNGYDNEGESGDSRLDFVKQRLARAQHSGLALGTLVNEVGKHENANYHHAEWRGPVVAELNSYADLHEIVRVENPDGPGGKPESRFYVPEFAP